MEFISQYKGKALEKITPKALLTDGYYKSIKRDGQCVQIAFDAKTKEVKMWSSNGHPFYNTTLADFLKKSAPYSFHVEAEFTGFSNGMLNDRGLSSRITTYRTEFAKGILSLGHPKEHFYVFDILSFDNEDVRQDPFSARYAMLMQLSYNLSFMLVLQTSSVTIEQGKKDLHTALAEGYEGLILTHPTHVIKDKGRSNLRIKLKDTPTGYATIVGTKPGEEDRAGTIGSLLVRDEDGFVFSAGTGLNSREWVLDPDSLNGILIKFGYESVKDGNYQQPRYLGAVLPDKSIVRLNEYSEV